MYKRIKNLIIPASLSAVILFAPMSVYADVYTSPADAAKAGITYLANNQKADGSINGLGSESDWAVEAIKLTSQDPDMFAHNGSPSLLDYLKTDVMSSSTASTSIERRIISINAAGLDSTNFGGVNYNLLLGNQHQSGQIGDPTLLNDDIFGIIAIASSHDNSLKPEAQDSLNYLLSHQGSDGGFSYTTASCSFCGSDNNDTAAAIVAMYAADQMGLTSSSLDSSKANALKYLLSTQQTDGGFAYDAFSPSDGSSTAWSLMALNEVGDAVSAQALLARSWLLHNQNIDGGFSYGAYGTTTSDTYTTDNAVIALMGSTWLLSPSPVTTPQTPPPSPVPTTTTTATPSVAQTVTSTSVPETKSVDSTASVPDTSVPNIDASQAAQTVKDAGSLLKVPNKRLSSTAITTHKNYRYEIYGAVLLVLVAMFWFMIESRQARKVKNEI
ncbi:MAG: prenyltransferase/squalene oxidase repeat-containing protein [Candidatus Saccharimonadales bacterium]